MKQVNGYHIVRALKDADALYCKECDRIWYQHENPFWGLNKTKGLHERGIGHKTYYIGPDVDWSLRYGSEEQPKVAEYLGYKERK